METNHTATPSTREWEKGLREDWIKESVELIDGYERYLHREMANNVVDWFTPKVSSLLASTRKEVEAQFSRISGGYEMGKEAGRREVIKEITGMTTKEAEKVLAFLTEPNKK